MNGYFRTRMGSDQGIGGQRMDQFFASVQYTTGQYPDVVFLDGGTNDIAASHTITTMISDFNSILNALWAAKPNTVVVMMPLLAQTGDSGATTTLKAQFNAYIVSRQHLHRPFALISVPIPATWNPATMTTDGTHYNQFGALLMESVLANKLAPYTKSLNNVFSNTGVNSYYGANLDTETSLSGTTGTCTSCTGSVADGKNVTNATGATVVASKGTLNGQTSQVILVSGTSTGGNLTFTEKASSSITLIGGVPGAAFEHFIYAKITAADGVSAPTNLQSMWEVNGSLGNHFSTTSNSTDPLAQPVTGVFKCWPMPLRTTSASITPTVVFTIPAGAVDLRIEFIMPRERILEQTSYGAPFYIGSDGIKSATETLRITGTAGVGNVLTGEPGTWSGGAITHSPQWYRDTVAIGGATAYTYTQVAGDSGHTLTFGTNPSNLYGANTTARSAGVVVP